MRLITMLSLAAVLLASLSPTPALTDPPELPRYFGFYNDREFRVARPGARPVSNFFPVRGFRPVDPACFSGVVSSEFQGTLETMPGLTVFNFERINIRRTSRGTRFPYSHHWDISSDPFSLMGVTSTIEGSGSGTARAWLAVNIPMNWFRLVTDTRPRDGQYVIDTTGPGISKMAFEDFFFYMADHHYSYVDLSQLQAHSGEPAVQAALAEIDTLVSNPPPNVFMGFLDFALNPDGTLRDVIRISNEEPFEMRWSGIKTTGMRRVSLTITCPDLVREFQDFWAP